MFAVSLDVVVLFIILTIALLSLGTHRLNTQQFINDIFLLLFIKIQCLVVGLFN